LKNLSNDIQHQKSLLALEKKNGRARTLKDGDVLVQRD